MINLYMPVWFFVGVFSATIVLGFILAPYILFKDEKEKADLLAKRQEPKLRVRTASDDLQAVRIGSTSQTLGASRHTVETNRLYVASILCTNDGLETVRNCKCSLVALWKQAEGEYNRIPLYESVELSWSRDIKNPTTYESIEPNETKAVYIASVHPQGYAWLYRKIDGLLLEYQQIFGGPGKYQLLLQFKSREPDPLQVLIDLDIKKTKPEVNKLPQSEASIVIIEQGHPPLSQTSIAT